MADIVVPTALQSLFQSPKRATGVSFVFLIVDHLAASSACTKI